MTHPRGTLYPLNPERALGDLHDLTAGEEPVGCFFEVAVAGTTYRANGVSFSGTPGIDRTATFSLVERDW